MCTITQLRCPDCGGYLWIRKLGPVLWEFYCPHNHSDCCFNSFSVIALTEGHAETRFKTMIKNNW